MSSSMSTGRFLFRVTVLHVVTYFVVGIVAAVAIDYGSLFEQPVVRDYMRAFGSVALFIGPVVQILRGLLIATVLLPFRSALATRLGWLWLWLLLVGVGIVSTYAAAPSSIEGIVYTKLPLWYHAIGLPEMLVQTLLFSVLTAFYVRHPKGILAALPPVFERIVRALVVASLAFVGYAGVSVVFALAAGAGLDAEQNLTLRVQGLFLAPFLLNGAIAFVAATGVTVRGRAIAGVASYALGVISILGYQALVTEAVDLGYATIAPLVPAVIVALLAPRATEAEPAGTTTGVTREPDRGSPAAPASSPARPGRSRSRAPGAR